MTDKQKAAALKKKAKAFQMLQKASDRHEAAMQRSSELREKRFKRLEDYLVACGWEVQTIYRGRNSWFTDVLFKKSPNRAWFTPLEALKNQERSDKRAKNRKKKV